MDSITEEEYAHAEREGKRLNDLVCIDCPDPALCAAEGECPRDNGAAFRLDVIS